MHHPTTQSRVPSDVTTSDLAVLIPCLNEALTIGGVVADFRRALPNARICVFDNASTDATAAIARDAGAEVFASPIRGKGNVVRHMLRAVDASRYLLVDGDGTYSAAEAGRLLDAIESSGADMIVGRRLQNAPAAAFPRFHRFGNALVAFLVSRLFPVAVSDVLSGYRVFTRALANALPLSASGFEIETELTAQAAAEHFRIGEVPISYGTRPRGSASKLRTFRDGFRVLYALMSIFFRTRLRPTPSRLWSLAGACAVLALLVIAAACGETGAGSQEPVNVTADAVIVPTLFSCTVFCCQGTNRTDRFDYSSCSNDSGEAINDGYQVCNNRATQPCPSETTCRSTGTCQINNNNSNNNDTNDG